MIKPSLQVDYESMALQMQSQLENTINQRDDLQQQVYGLEEDVDKLKAVVEYLEMKLGIHNSI